MSLAVDIQGWVGAIGTGGGFLIAAGVYAASLRDRRRRQASLVNAWSRRQLRPAKVVVQNSSDEPAYNVSFEMRSRLGHSPTITVSCSIEVLPPHETMVFPDEHEPMHADILRYASNAPLDLPVGVSFTDTAGRRWRRKFPDYRLRRDRRASIASRLAQQVRLLPILLIQAVQEGIWRLRSAVAPVVGRLVRRWSRGSRRG